MKISIIGASSFIGKNFISLFDNNFKNLEIVGTQRSESNSLDYVVSKLKYAKYKKIFLDLKKESDFKFLLNSDLLIFLSGISKPNDKLKKEDFDIVNIQSLQNIFKKNNQLKIKKFIIFSSTEAVGANFEKKPFDEKTPPKPRNHYGKNKLLLENVCNEYFKKGLNINLIRPTTIYGKYDKEFIKFFKLNKLRFFPIRSELNCIEYLNVKDLFFATLQIYKLGKPGEIYNAGPKNKVSLNYILKIIENISQKKWINFKLSNFLINTFFNETFDRLNKFKFNSNFNKIEKIGFQQKITLEVGIKELYFHYLKHKDLY